METQDIIEAFELELNPRPFVEQLGLEQALSVKRQAGMDAFFKRIRSIAYEHS